VRERRRGPAKVSEVMADLLAGSALGARIARAEVLEHWARAVGPQIAAVTRARAIAENGTMTIGVKTNGWMQELAMMERSLLAKVNKSAGREVVRKIRWELLR
jgi:predicted nucleic acid-binding Zn ribbon protein